MVTKSEHEKERRAFWDAQFSFWYKTFSSELAANLANSALSERDKRFPAPEESETT